MPRQRLRTSSFDGVDGTKQASGMLKDILLECQAYIGGCSLGKGFQRAARHYLLQQEKRNHGKNLLLPAEDSFYVVDIGVVVSQVYQWRRFFPRVEVFYAVKCFPDPTILKTLAVLGCNFDCASQGEIELVQQQVTSLQKCTFSKQPEIIYANPCKAMSHIQFACQHGVQLFTFDNVAEVEKCARVQQHLWQTAAAADAATATATDAHNNKIKNCCHTQQQQQQQPQIQLILRILTDDRGAQCRLSSKYGAPKHQWRALLAACVQHNIPVVGVSFHAGSGCRDASRYQAALKDARKLFDLAQDEFGMDMSILDIGGGFPGETHSMWNPAINIDEEIEKQKEREGRSPSPPNNSDDADDDKFSGSDRYMFFTEIAEKVAPMIDALFPEESGVRIIAEPGRYLVAACATLCCSVTSMRSNATDPAFAPLHYNETELLRDMSISKNPQHHSPPHHHHQGNADDSSFAAALRMRSRSTSSATGSDASSIADANVLQAIRDGLVDYSKLFANQQRTQQDVDAYNDPLDLYKEDYETAKDLLGLPDKEQVLKTKYTVEGMNYRLVSSQTTTNTVEKDDGKQRPGFISLAAAGEAAMSGLVVQCVADSDALQDDYAYYLNDGVYGAFNNLMFDHASCRARVLKADNDESESDRGPLYMSTVFGPTCDSIDVIARSVLLPKLKVGDWLYFENMGAYTAAAASGFNGFVPSKKMYVCSVQPEYFERLIAGPEGDAHIQNGR